MISIINGYNRSYHLNVCIPKILSYPCRGYILIPLGSNLHNDLFDSNDLNSRMYHIPMYFYTPRNCLIFHLHNCPIYLY